MTQRRSLADKLDHLFRMVHPAGRDEYTYREVADEINRAAQDRVISHSYIWMLRNGRADNPTRRQIEALAGFFGVRAAYFHNDDEDAVARVDAQLDLALAMRDAQVRRMAQRSVGLSPDGRGAVNDLIERLRLIEKVDKGRKRAPDPGEDLGDAAAPPGIDGSD